jgi:co-chaperonin GroES (HSP10)
MVAAATTKKLIPVPLNDEVLIEEIPRDTGLIVIPDGADAGPTFGRVVAVGPGKWENGAYSKVCVEPGDTVAMFANGPIVEVPLCGKEYKIVRSVYLKCKVVEG